MKDNKRGFSIIDAMNGLFRFTNTGALNANEIALYVILLSKWNELGRPNEFNLSRGIILSNSGMLKNTFYRTRNKIRQKGLIDFTIRGGRKSTVYSLCPIYKTQPGTFSGTFSGTQPGTIHREEKSREKIKKESKERKKPQTENSKLYAYLRKMLGPNSIGILKNSKISLEFAVWLIRHYQVMAKKQPILYLIALSHKQEIFAKWQVFTSDQFKLKEAEVSDKFGIGRQVGGDIGNRTER